MTGRFTRIALAVSLASCCAATFAVDNAALDKFARANADKFTNEIAPTAGIDVGTKVTVRGSLDYIDVMPLLADYEPDAGQITFGPLANFHSLALFTTCKPTGSFAGQNAYGAKTLVRRESCERLVVSSGDPMGARLAGLHLKMTPAQYREIKKSGLKAEVDFTIGDPKKTVPVDASASVSSATVDSPTETHMRAWIVYGQLEEVRWVLPGDAAPTRIWARQP